MTGRWVIDSEGLKLLFSKADFDADIRRAVEWQAEFERRVARYRARYEAFSALRRTAYRWLGVGLGWEASLRSVKHKVLASQ